MKFKFFTPRKPMKMARPAAGIASEREIEAAIVKAGKTAPRLKPEDIDAAIKSEAYYRFPGTTLTVCCLTLVNGFTVSGESATASTENFDEGIGRQIARENARNKIWTLEGYILKDKLYWLEQFDATGELSSGAKLAHTHF